MPYAGDLSVQFKRKQLADPLISTCFFNKVMFCRCHDIDQDLPGLYGLSDQQMTEISYMAHTMVVRKPRLSGKTQGTCQYFSIVFIYDSAFHYIHNIMETASFMHSQSQRPILILIAKREFHLIAVGLLYRARHDSFPAVISLNCLIHHSLHLCFFHLKLLFIGKILISTSPALSKMRTGGSNLRR